MTICLIIKKSMTLVITVDLVLLYCNYEIYRYNATFQLSPPLQRHSDSYLIMRHIIISIFVILRFHCTSQYLSRSAFS